MHQLDIFADSAAVQRTNALLAALARFDRAAAWAAFNAMRTDDVPEATRGKMAVLCRFLDGWPDQPEMPDAEAVSALVSRLETQIVPVTDVLGNAAGTFLCRCWSTLAAWSEASGIGAGDSRCFAAELHLRARQWPEVIRTAANVAGGAQRARVQRWLALAHHQRGDRDDSRIATIRFAWLAPQSFAELLSELRDAGLSSDWRNFLHAFGDLDASWFPAWYAHEHEVASDERATLTESLPAGDGPAAWRLIVGLKIRERQGVCPALLEDRARLKRLDEGFFTFYMRHRTDAGLDAF